MLAAIESLLSAVVADSMSGDRHKPDVELVAQGVANMVAPLFGGIPATGAIARTATNIRSGAKTPVAGIVHALTLLVVLLVGGAARPLHSAGHPGRRPVRRRLQHGRVARDRPNPALLASRPPSGPVTFALTVFADLTVAVEVGMVLAALLYIHQVTDHDLGGSRDARIHQGRQGPHPAGQAHPRLRDHPPHPRPVPVRGGEQTGASDRRPDSTSTRSSFCGSAT